MAFDDSLANRCRAILKSEEGVAERKMFGGLSFLLNGKMICGVLDRRLVVRISPDAYSKTLHEPHVKPMDFTGRPMKGFVYVLPEGYRHPASLRRWIGKALSFGRTLAGKGK